MTDHISVEAYRQLVGTPKKPRRYRNIPVDGFDSRHEKAQIQALRLRERAGDISDLCTDKRLLRYALVVHDKFICAYEADARWTECATGEVVVADAKSPPTRKKESYVIKIKLMAACLNIYVKEL